MANPTTRSGSRRFSLAAALLFVATVGALAAWWGANQRMERAVREARQLRVQLEQYQAELGQLSVIDPTKVHAIGLRMRPEDGMRWKWRVYLPPTRVWKLVLVAGPQSGNRNVIGRQLQGEAESNRMAVVNVAAGAFVMEAAVVPGNADQAHYILACAIDGRPCGELQLSAFNAAADYDQELTVGPNERSVWEPGERPLLLSLRQANGQAERQTEGTAATKSLAIWLWESPSAETAHSGHQRLTVE